MPSLCGFHLLWLQGLMQFVPCSITCTLRSSTYRSAVAAPACDAQQTVALALAGLPIEQSTGLHGRKVGVWRPSSNNIVSCLCQQHARRASWSLKTLLQRYRPLSGSLYNVTWLFMMRCHVTIHDELYHSLFTASAHAERQMLCQLHNALSMQLSSSSC